MDVANAVHALRQRSDHQDLRIKKLKIFSYVLPLVKNPQNVWLLCQELAMSPGLFTNDYTQVAETSIFASEAVSAAAEHKYQISDPTITPVQWEDAIKKAAYTVPPLIGLILLSGIAGYRSQRFNESIIQFAGIVCKDPVLLKAGVCCLSRVELTDDQFSQLDCDLLATKASRCVFSLENLDLVSPISSTQLGAWSRLIRGLLTHSHVYTLRTYFETVQMFVRTAVAHNLSVDKLRGLFFGLVIQLEGVVNYILKTISIAPASRTNLAISVLKIMQPLGFVASSVGTQFESYQYVVNACIDALSVYPAAAEHAVHALSEGWGYGKQLSSSEAAAGELVFLFEIAEKLMPLMDSKTADVVVLPIARRFIRPPSSNNYDVFHTKVFEASHSVTLAFLASNNSFAYSKRRVALNYLQEVMQLFPNFFSGSQLRTAFLTVLSSLDRPDINTALNHVWEATQSSPVGALLPNLKSDKEPPTIRSALVSTLIHGVINYSNHDQLRNWLENINKLVPNETSKEAKLEKDFMLKDFADIATSGTDEGVLWWFKHFENHL